MVTCKRSDVRMGGESARPGAAPTRRWFGHRLAITAAVLVGLVAGACSASAPLLESRNVGPENSYPVAGTSYYLPKVVLRVQVWRYRAMEPEFDRMGKAVMNEDGTPKGRVVTRHFAMHAKDGSDDVIIPDLRHQFVIAPQWDVASDDYLQVNMAPDGLLKEVYGHATDERTEIARGLTDLFSMLVSGPGRGSKWEQGPRPSPHRGLDLQLGIPSFVAEYEFDPVDPKDRARVERALAGYAPGIKMTLTKQADCPSASSGAGCGTACDCTKPGIYYRLPIPYRLSLKPAGKFRAAGAPDGYGTQSGEWESLDGGMERTVLLPNEAICMFAPVNRASFVTSHTSLRFERGMLVEVKTDKPSQLLGFVRIPVDVASAILAIPADLLTIRIQQSNLKTDLANQRQAEMNAEKAQLDAQIQMLDAARRAKAPASDGSGDSDLYPR